MNGNSPSKVTDVLDTVLVIELFNNTWKVFAGGFPGVSEIPSCQDRTTILDPSSTITMLIGALGGSKADSNLSDKYMEIILSWQLT